MLGSRRVNIYMQCPGCAADYGHAVKEFWRHGGRCQGVLQLDEYANVICGKCGSHAHLTEMRLSCNSGRHMIFTPGAEKYAQSISCSSAFVNNMGMAWLQSVIRYLDV